MAASRFPIRWKLLRMARRLGFHIETALPVPAAMVTGSVGKTTVCSMTAAILAAAGRRVALTTTTGCFVDGRMIRTGDSSGSRFAALVTSDPAVDAAVLEMARGAILLEGIPFRACDVGAVLNVQDEHLGCDGIHSREELARVKSLVAAKAERLAVLNADDPLVMAMREVTRARDICLVSRRPDSSVVRGHLAAGGLAALLDQDPCDAGGTLRLRRGDVDIAAVAAADIPATYDGRFTPPAVNALFAMAIAHGMGIDAATIRTALAAFRSDASDNPGRMNLHRGLPCTLLATKAGGVAAAEAIAEFAHRFEVPGRKLLVVSAVGNRTDDVLRSWGRGYGSRFDHHVCSDWEDRRGRPPGETAMLLAQGLREAGVPPHAIEIEPDHDTAIRKAHAATTANDLLVVASLTAWRAPEIIRGCRPERHVA